MNWNNIMKCKHDKIKGWGILLFKDICPHKKKVISGFKIEFFPKRFKLDNMHKCEYQEICKHFELDENFFDPDYPKHIFDYKRYAITKFIKKIMKYYNARFGKK